jgi:hypothetical protein
MTLGYERTNREIASEASRTFARASSSLPDAASTTQV